MTSRVLTIAPNALRIDFSVRWFGVVTVRGTLSTAEGTVTLRGEDLSQVEVAVAASAGSVHTGVGLRDHHLRAERFLHADLYPWIRFTSTAFSREGGELVVQGMLSCRGVTTPVRASCPLDEVQRDGEQASVCARFVLSRSRHGVGVPPGIWRYNPMFLAIADEVRVHVRLRLPAAEVERLGLLVQGARPRAATGHDDST
ncbi:MAG: YceI family protein [Gemmatimonadetes bacterium]|nr:YceI family protein [Gemmatimonadota bacterium]